MVWLLLLVAGTHADDAEHADHDEVQPDNMQVNAPHLHCVGSHAIISDGCSGSQ